MFPTMCFAVHRVPFDCDVDPGVYFRVRSESLKPRVADVGQGDVDQGVLFEAVKSRDGRAILIR